MANYFLFLFIMNFLSMQDEPKFEPQVVDDNVAIGYGLATGDVDGDGKPDVLLADKKQFVWYRNGDWKRFVMVENLTESDNVCIAARDIDNDGKVEVAVGAQWNPSETTDTLKSGSVHFLIRPKDPTQRWTPIKLHHEPTVHRMRWVKAEGSKFHLIVLPLHGRGNKNGEGEPVKVIAYEVPKNPAGKWAYTVIDESMHLTHNLDIVAKGKTELIYVGGKEGIKTLSFAKGKWSSESWLVTGESFGEIRAANTTAKTFVAGVQPMHGNMLSVYSGNKNPQRTILTSTLNQGHALAVDDLLKKGNNQIVVGWREPNEEKKTGIKIFVPNTAKESDWTEFWIDDNGIACEDLQIVDLNGDGKKDIVAAGRATHNLKIYWNKSF